MAAVWRRLNSERVPVTEPIELAVDAIVRHKAMACRIERFNRNRFAAFRQHDGLDFVGVAVLGLQLFEKKTIRAN